MIGETISHYRVTDKLGAGGMGEVYVAEDTKLNARQSDIAEQVSENMGIVLGTPEKHAVWERWTENAQAYDLLLRGDAYAHRHSGYAPKKDFIAAFQMYRQAIELDSHFALAYARMSQAYSRLCNFDFDLSDSCRDLSKLLADKALQISPDLKAGHAALANYSSR